MSDCIGLAHHLLDHQLLDTRGERCGKVDDVALRDVDGRVELAAVLAGAGVLRERYRGHLMRWLIGLGGDGRVVVPARAIGEIDGQVHLTGSAPSLGLASGEQRAAGIIARILGPEARAVELGRDASAQAVEPTVETEPDTVCLSLILGRQAVDTDGNAMGRIRDLRFERSGRILDEAAGAAWVLTHVLVGRGGLEERYGVSSGERGAIAVDGLSVRGDQVTLHVSRQGP